MSGFLLDTNVISMLSPSAAEASARFLEWLERMDSEGRVFLSVVAIHEIEKGIALLEHKGATAKAATLKAWLAGLVAAYDDKNSRPRCVPRRACRTAGAKAISAGQNPGMADAIVAGVAKAHDLIIVTRNMKHFQPFGVGASSPD